MSFITPITRMQRIDYLIRTRTTGSPQQLAEKIGISERALYEDLGYLKDHFGCPIAYCREQESYYYTENGVAHFGFEAKD